MLTKALKMHTTEIRLPFHFIYVDTYIYLFKFTSEAHFASIDITARVRICVTSSFLYSGNELIYKLTPIPVPISHWAGLLTPQYPRTRREGTH